jgi:peptidoglycan hydrolase CwlO-like protein/3D (Asp-Asp-Asp) domain-containing protein
MNVVKKSLPLILVILLLCTSITAFGAEDPQSTIANNKVKFQQMNNNLLDTNKKISDLNTQIDKLKKDISKNNTAIDKNNKQIETEKAHMEQLLKEVNDKQAVANRRIRAMYINGYNENIIGSLLLSKSFSDAVSRFEAVKKVINFDKKVFSDLSEKKKNLNESIKTLDVKGAELQKLKDNNDTSLKQLDEDKTKLQDLAKQFEEQKQNAAQLIKENEERLIAHAISVIDSNTSRISDMKNALMTLNSLLPQLSTDSVKQTATSYIGSGNKKLTEMIARDSNANGNEAVTFKATYVMNATAYSGGTLTAMGLKPIRDPAGLSTIAVDPSVIPLGTKVYIAGYGYAICSDTGGAIKGNIIDLYMSTEAECYAWGRRTVTLNIVAYPGEW